LVIRGSDVPTYVQHGAADMGVSGKDMLLEASGADLYEPLDLNISKCRLMTAGLVGKSLPQGRVRIATKFTNIAKRYCAEKGIQADIIKLYGAMELAPIMDLADMIVDIVDTGNTLKANGMEPQDLIANISSRLVVNRAAMKCKHKRIQQIIDQLRHAVEAVA
jgi:ATP phosphoribosyltransferase